MREIKFRAWDKVSEDWHYIEITKSIFETQMALPSQPMMHGGQVDGLEWQQYTGLKDKNGVEIYEGDIVKAPHYIIGKEPTYYENRVVKYLAPSFVLALGIDEEYDIDNFSTPLAFEEVIGNIYENPELLEANQ